MKTIYVVFGTTGEYSDRTEWPVKAYASLKKAKTHILEADKVADAIFVKREGRMSSTNEETNPFDEDFRMDYTGTSYYYIETELEE